MYVFKVNKEITDFIDTESVHNTVFCEKKIIKHSCKISHFHFKYLQINTHTMA